jgi:hypothetical protein
VPPKQYLIYCCLLAGTFFVAGCKKKQQFNQETGQVTVDARLMMGENDEVIKEINTIMMEQYLLRGKSSGTSSTTGSVCGAKIDTTAILSGVIVIRYDGSNCSGRTRSGEVKFAIQGYPLKKWKQPGTVVKIDFINYKVVRASDSRVIKFSGTEYMTNQSGNSFFELWYMFQPNVVYTLKGDAVQVTFDENALAIMNCDRKLTFTYSDNVTSCVVEGTGSNDGKSQAEHWGQARDGQKYTCRITGPVVWRTSCGAMAPASGQSVISLEDRDYELTSNFGVDEAAKPVSSGCAYGFEVTWKRKNKVNSRIFGYY